MEIHYDLDDDVLGIFHDQLFGRDTMFVFENGPSAAAVDQGDISGVHHLQMDSDLMQDAAANYQIKWEGLANFDPGPRVEKADEIFLEADQDGHEAETGTTFSLPDYPQILF